MRFRLFPLEGCCGSGAPVSRSSEFGRSIPVGESPLCFCPAFCAGMSQMALSLDKVREIADRVAAAYGLEVFDLEFRSGAGKQGRLLRVALDRVIGQATGTEGEVSQAGVTLEDCANV